MQTTTACFAPGVKGLLTPLQGFLEDDHVSEILINRPQEVFVERQGEMHRFELPTLTRNYIRRLFQLIANENRQVLSSTCPLLSGNLEDGSRVQLVIPEASQFETLSIRKFTLKSLSFDDYKTQGFFDASHLRDKDKQNENEHLRALYKVQNWQAFIHNAILAKKNILISGGTSSGKTTFLNSCVSLIPKSERLIILEDTYEIQTSHPNVVRLKALKQLSHQEEGITMQDLVQASLRLRPDRLIMGEIRGREIFDFVSAGSTGHSGTLATIHANSPKIAFMRMAQLYKLNKVGGMTEDDIFKTLNEVIDVIVQLEKTHQGRRLVEVYYKDVT